MAILLGCVRIGTHRSFYVYNYTTLVTHFVFHTLYPGQKAGYLGSAFFIGSFAGSMTWGWLSDILGRRPVMLLGVCGTVFSELLFGFSQNFGWAVAGRFLWGLLNGNLGVVKTYVSEVG